MLCLSSLKGLCWVVFFAPQVGSAPQYVLHLVTEHPQLFQPVLVETSSDSGYRSKINSVKYFYNISCSESQPALPFWVSGELRDAVCVSA